MADIVTKETITTRRDDTSNVVETSGKNSGAQTFAYLIYFLFGVLEVLLIFRLILKLAGANTGSAFVMLIYNSTAVFIAPFEGIFHRGFAQGVETTSVLEPSTLVAIIVYALLAVGIVKLVQIFSGNQGQVE